MFGLQQKCCELVSAQGLHLPVLGFGEGAAIRGIMRDQVLLDRKLHSGRNDLVDIADSFRLRPFACFSDSFRSTRPSVNSFWYSF